MEIEKLNILLEGKGISVHGFCSNSKASESYVSVTFTQDDGSQWDTVVPYEYRRSYMKLENEEDIAEYLISIKPFFTKASMNEWKTREWKKWKERRSKMSRPEKFVTIKFFKELLTFKEVVDFKNPSIANNRNPQRRLQDLKDEGYVISIYPVGNNKHGKILLPIPLIPEMRYETFSPQFKKRVIRLFNGINAYEAKQTSLKALIPDHKFSEVRWDENTSGENLMTMSDEEIIDKFQLLDNQRNQQKREICRNCVQTGKRGEIYGIEYYPVGGPMWDNTIPAKGKDSEKGCLGCPWYDIEAWRKEVNKLLKNR